MKRYEQSAQALRRFAQERRASAIVEFALLMPWLVFLFLGTFDIGMYIYLLITVENAARVAALQASLSTAGASNSAAACQIALKEMSALQNVSKLSSCGSGTVSATAPVSVVATLHSYSATDSSTRVTVKYLSPQIIVIPGVFPSQMTIQRTAEAPIATI